jgi:hypothetical protein
MRRALCEIRFSRWRIPDLLSTVNVIDAASSATLQRSPDGDDQDTRP